MIDIKLIRENPEKFKAACKAKNIPADIDLLMNKSIDCLPVDETIPGRETLQGRRDQVFSHRHPQEQAQQSQNQSGSQFLQVVAQRHDTVRRVKALSDLGHSSRCK